MALQWSANQHGQRAVVTSQRFITELPDGSEKHVYDVAVSEATPLVDVEARLVAVSAIRDAVIELAARAGDLGLDKTWLDLQGVEDQLGYAVDALRQRRLELMGGD